MTDLKPTKPFVAVRDHEPGLAALNGAVVALGNFDGVHRGHRQVIATALARARALGRPAAALTFEPHPRAFFRPGEPLFRLTDETNKLRLFAASGAVVGFNFHFGKDRAGSPAFLAEEGTKRGLAVDVVPVFSHNGRPVSSGPIRDA